MPLRRRFLALLFAPLLLTGCAALAAMAGAAPLVGSALDAYTATARALASPTSSPIDVQALADALRDRDTCTVKASAALMPTATPDRAQARAQARALIRDAIAADTRLLAALDARPADPIADAGAAK